ncbi:MAG: nucleotide pyrophosphatase [Candidatus Thermoplasmatota archaeon]|nr:nucleotide pyrophosphatase [Candidatus Thermoplasmatota archaeon]
MKLNPLKNFIVSGLERSGTSMLMQILHNGGYPVSADETRPPDNNNPLGYYELEGGKIINRLMEKRFPFDRYRGSFIKITSYGLKFLPDGEYVILYSERNIEEILDSMEKMARITDENREETKTAFLKLNRIIKQQISERLDCDVLFVNYNEIISNPETHIKKINDFLNQDNADLNAMISTVNKDLYRQRRK